MKKGYCAGKNASFLPSSDADWIEDFNTMLKDSSMSRNAFTEMLLREAVRARMGLAVSNSILNSSTAVESLNTIKIDTKLDEILKNIKNMRLYAPELKEVEERDQAEITTIDQQQEDPQNILMNRLQAISPK